MGRKKRIASQLSNFGTYNMTLRQMKAYAQNVYLFKHIPDIIDMSYVNKILVNKGSIACFYEETLDSILMLPYRIVGDLNIYGQPNSIVCIGKNGYTSKVLKSDEFVIIYDNEGRYPLINDIYQYAERVALLMRTQDINISQQKTPRFWNVPAEKELTFKHMVAEVDSAEETVLTYKDLNIDEIQSILAPAPYVTDKLQLQIEKAWSDFFRLIGITSVTYQKKERLISDEISQQNGGVVASRYNRYNPRLKAIEEINKKFGQYLEAPLEVEFYDGLPTTLKEEEVELDDI